MSEKPQVAGGGGGGDFLTHTVVHSAMIANGFWYNYHSCLW